MSGLQWLAACRYDQSTRKSTSELVCSTAISQQLVIRTVAPAAISNNEPLRQHMRCCRACLDNLVQLIKFIAAQG